MRLLRIQLTSCDQRSNLLPLALPHNPRSSVRCHHHDHQAQAGVLRSTKLWETIMVVCQCHCCIPSV
ncbi:hypothetical protein BDP81DRAFT_413041 [Colletotrichum phormii]|uniref:Uncharacterized protein n=1 Tax=Colletotrichum phormii TaxID=359342 RepID=A0AAJ0A5Y3_9PEZI|nr:uncharacterized protein BDP81DRAFT_413041 [Colletotrichum phormii]KAK1655627.1 hypothetical protein BDP81DRAFT_413041 [Colletotrichum phormii]